MSRKSEIKIYRSLMGRNEFWAARTRRLLGRHNVKMLNLIGSPGSGKTSLLEKAAARLGGLEFAVLEGDIAGTADARRLHARNIRVCQLLTCGACHLNARLVHAAVADLPLAGLDLIIVENVGNLVCPAEFDIGEDAKVAVLSVTEGEDKPEKYPMLFREAACVVLTKTDLLPHLSCRLSSFLANIRRVNGAIPVFPVSALSGRGVSQWCAWVSRLASGV